MSDKSDKAATNGVAGEPLQRLASIKPPRDLSLGGVKPNKKIFTPNLNVTRNKNKGPAPNVRDNKRDDKGKRERRNDRNRNFKNGPNIIKSGGVFSEGLGSVERQSNRSSYYSREGDGGGTPALQKPTIRVKDVVKIDKEFEEQRIKAIVGNQNNEELESEDFKHILEVDAPVKLPMDDGGWAHSQAKVPVKIKQEVVVKQEPADDIDCPNAIVEDEPKIDVKEVFEDTNVVNLLRSEKPTLMLLQLPDTLPGRGGSSEDDAPRRKPAHNDPSTSSATDAGDKKMDNRCRLSDLEEGRIGKLLVHRSGRVTFALGDTMFEMCSGTKAAFHQEVVSMAVDETSRSANLISLGPLQHKLNITPEWETMFSTMAV
ncbi:DNA-directed RNA polymerase III subunit RPC4 isoform X2 [Epargyreus clarus]|uniref:DNA-directed RNA polymerase III subunit RPC4 isoform X2 n=1 Tax=Epargyreus clarus TaxID=520877 RepID=UPI003C2FAFB4